MLLQPLFSWGLLLSFRFDVGCKYFRRELYLPRLLLLLLLLFSASASIPKHPLPFLYLRSRHKQQQVEFMAEILAVMAQSLRASGHVPET